MNTSPLALNPPRVPVAVANGGLRWLDLSDPSAPVQVQAVLTPNSARPGDLFVLYWQAENAASVTANPDHMQIGVVTFSVLPADILRFVDGDHSLYYTVTSVIGGSTEQSPLTMVKVKRLIPGGYDPDAGSEYINENLKSPLGIPNLIDDSVQSVTVTIPDYENREDDDTVQVDWSGHRITTPDAASPLGFTVTRAILEATPGRVICRYDVRDVVNNWSKWSLSTETESEVGENFLMAPRVLDAVNGIIDLAVLGDADVRVQVAPYNLAALGAEPRMVLDDHVELTWTGYTAQGFQLDDIKSDKTVKFDDIGWPLDFIIPNATVKLIPQGRAVLSYSVTPLTGASRGSRRLSVQVIGQVQLLPAPLVLEQSGGILDPAALPATGATVRVEASQLIVKDDALLLKWDGMTQAGTPFPYSIALPVTEDTVGKSIDTHVSLAFITPLIEGSVTVSYALTKPDGAVVSSFLLPLQISGQAQQLLKPTIDYAVGDQLDPADVPPSGSTVRVNYSPMIQNDRVDMSWTGTVSFSVNFTVPDGWGSDEIAFPVAKAYVSGNAGETVLVSYTVTQNGVVLPSSPVQRLEVKAAGVEVRPAILQVSGANGDVPDKGDTTDTSLQLAGTAAPNVTIEILEAGSRKASAQATASGRWTTSLITFALGAHSITSITVGGTLVSAARMFTVNAVVPPMNLIAPSLREAVGAGGGRLDYYAVNDDVHAIVPNYNMKVGDTVKIYWRGNIEIGTEVQEVKSPMGPLSFTISKYEVIDVIGRHADFWYTVRRPPDNVIQSSLTKRIIVEPHVPDVELQAPLIDRDHRNVSVLRGALLSDSTARVRWIGVAEHETAHKEFKGLDILNFIIPASWVTENRGRYVMINYSVRYRSSDTLYLFSRMLRIDL
jgi:hypothetical protein